MNSTWLWYYWIGGTPYTTAPTETTAMELFILVLIGKMGLTSLYAFRKEAGLEPGGVASALKALEARELITRKEPGKRRRRDMALTAAGHGFLEEHWTSCLRENGDSEAVLRSVFVVQMMSGLEHAAAHLEDAGIRRQSMAREMKMQQEHLDRSQIDPLSTYEWMRICTEAHRREAESKAFLSISQSLRERSRKDFQALDCANSST